MVRASVGEMKTPLVSSLKPYPEYKESDQPWLGMIPKHWNLRRMKYLFSERVQKGFPKEPLLAATQTLGVIRKTDYGARTVEATKDFHLLKLVEDGDYVISLRSFEGGIEYSHCRGIISPAYTILKSSLDARREYFEFLFKSSPFIDSLRLFVTGIREGQNIDYERLSRAFLPIPLIEDQKAIGRFLRFLKLRTERYIRAKKKVIALLNEQKQNIIHQAVTSGLDSNACLQSSTSQWFPKIPQDWSVRTLRRVINAAIDGPHFSPKYLDHGIPFLSARNVKADRWSLGNVKFISEADYQEFNKRVRPEVGDVLYTKGGTTGVARAVDLTFPFQVWVHIAVLKLKRDKIDPEYLALTLNSPRCYEQSQLFTRGATNQDLGLGRMKNIELPLPPTLSEQCKLVESLKKAVSAQNTIIDSTLREIDLIREYRRRLISDVVTGKLDVREAAAKLPEESDDSGELLLNDGDEEIEEMEAEDASPGEDDE